VQQHAAAARGAGVGGVGTGYKNSRIGEARREELSRFISQSFLFIDVRLKFKKMFDKFCPTLNAVMNVLSVFSSLSMMILMNCHLVA
jgi:hypothetical protein